MNKANIIPKRSRKKISIFAGDVLLVPQSNGKYSIAYILGFWPKMESVMTVTLLSKEVAENAFPSEYLASLVNEAIEQRQLMSVISTTTGTAQVQEWPKVGSVTDIDITDLLPPIPYKTGSMVGGIYSSAPLVEGLVEAYRGLVDWKTILPGRPGYLESLVFSSDKKDEQRGDDIA